VFVDRCALATDLCRTEVPPIVRVGDGRWSRCHHIDRIDELVEGAAAAGSTHISGADAMLTLTGVSKTFHQSGHDVPALVKVDLQLRDGETLGLVGESGSGKSTLAKTILGIEAADVGSRMELDDAELKGATADRPTKDKRSIQMVFQNPDSALNRGWSVRHILSRSVSKLTGLKGKAVDERVDRLAGDLKLTQRHLDLKPRQLSGGLKQRVAIARAFAGDPRIVVADEPTSALDVSVQAAILNVLAELQTRSRTGYLLISHDLGVVRYLADRIAVMYLGRIQEVAESEVLFDGPNHPYTEALLSAVPSVDGEVKARIRLEGDIPSPANPPSGCVFHTRCHRFIENLCEVTEPPLIEVTLGHLIRCHIPADELRRLQARDEAVAEAAVEAGEEPPLTTSVLAEDPLVEPTPPAPFDPMPPDGVPPA
jgi:peptide/nickel transport system ATP-binding protein